MRCKILLISVFCVCTTFAAHAAQAAPQGVADAADAVVRAEAEAKAKAEAVAKAKAEAEAARRALIGTSYAAELARLEQALKDYNLGEASAAAAALLDLSAEAGDRPWQSTIGTYRNLIDRFERQKVFGSRHTKAFYEAALKNVEDGNDKADLTLGYGLFLYTYALVDDREAMAVIHSAFDIPGVTERKKIDLCGRIVGHVSGRLHGRFGRATPYLEVERYTDKALTYARNDPAAVNGIAAWMVRGYGQMGRVDEIIPLYEKLLADKVFADQHARLGIEMVNHLNRNKEYAQALAYLNETIPTLEGPDKLRHLRLLAHTYERDAERYYADPDREDLKLAIAVYRDIIEEIPAESLLEVADARIAIAGLAYAIGDYETAVAEVDQALAVPDLAERRIFTKLSAEYLLGQTAYAQADYAGAVEILTRVRETMQGLEHVRPAQVPYRRDMLEKLVRGYCALGDLDAAFGLSDALLESMRPHERVRYQIYIDGLKQRIKTGP